MKLQKRCLTSQNLRCGGNRTIKPVTDFKINPTFTDSKNLRFCGKSTQQAQSPVVNPKNVPRMNAYRVEKSSSQMDKRIYRVNVDDSIGYDDVYGSLSWDRIIAGTAPGMATAYTLYGQPTTMKHTMFHYRLYSIFATSRRESARRRQHRRYAKPVKTNRKCKQSSQSC